jgi:hypothetical protein
MPIINIRIGKKDKILYLKCLEEIAKRLRRNALAL